MHAVEYSRPLEVNITFGGLKRSHISPFIRTKRNLKLTFDVALSSSKYVVTKSKPHPEIKLHINMENPISLITFKIRDLIMIKHNHTLTRENTTHTIRALSILTEGVQPRDNVRCSEPCSFVKRISLYLIVVDVEFFVWVTSCEVEDEVVMERVVVGCVVELGEFGFFDIEFETAWLNDDPDY